MCGRFVLEYDGEFLKAYYQTSNTLTFSPNYNIPPQTEIPVVIFESKISNYKLMLMRWGLVPHWAKDSKMGYKMINARGETVAEKPSFNSSFKYRRCLIPASGFYEWDRKSKEPYYISSRNQLFSFAGIWDEWQQGTSSLVTCSIITTESEGKLSKIHDRSPVVIDEIDQKEWLNPMAHEKIVRQMLHSIPEEKYQMWPVGKEVNFVRNNAPNLIDQ